MQSTEKRKKYIIKMSTWNLSRIIVILICTLCTYRDMDISYFGSFLLFFFARLLLFFGFRRHQSNAMKLCFGDPDEN